MSTSKNFDRFACIVVALMLVVTLLFMNGASLGIVKAETVLGYENRLFDNTKVHTIDIVMDDWEGFIANATSEEYYMANLIIDGEAYKNVGIRGKGNTSLSSVASMDSDRYSFKVEFDQYDSSLSYYGLDKICLNNLIQDSTMMKDYLTYTLMAEFGVNTPLCSFAYITVGGEDWGLYLVVEGVEDGFLARNYGTNQGNLYKPDSTNFGGGRGNGKDFDMGEFEFEDFDGENFTGDMPDMGNVPNMGDGQAMPDMGNMTDGSAPDMPANGVMPNMGEEDMGDMPGGTMPNGGDMPTMPTGDNAMPDMGQTLNNNDMPTMPGQNAGDTNFGGFGFGGFSLDADKVKEIFTKLNLDTALLDGIDWDNVTMDDLQSVLSQLDGDTMQSLMNEVMSSDVMQDFDFGDMGNFGMGSSDVKLQYIDENYDSYSNIFDSAKTKITDTDKDRLIASLKSLSNYTDIESVVDIDQVLRYFVVHNYVVNGDSYTGSMIHNYYLYEENGKLAMIPWDYNLAFGTFQGGSAQSTVNEPIDSPVSDPDDRPMWGWILSDESYTELYHQYFTEFLNTVDVQGIIEDAYNLIQEYVAKDPTKFYSYEEFEQGVSVLKQFCTLRTESITAQLANGDTTETMQYADASDITLSDMGSMNMGGGFGGDAPEMPDRENREMPDDTDRSPEATPDNYARGNTERPFNIMKEFGNTGEGGIERGNQNTAWVWLGVSAVVLLLGLVAAKVYRK